MNNFEKPRVKLIGENGNSFYILGKVRSALERAGATEKYVDQYMEEAMSADYNKLLTVTMKYVDVY